MKDMIYACLVLIVKILLKVAVEIHKQIYYVPYILCSLQKNVPRKIRFLDFLNSFKIYKEIETL